MHSTVPSAASPETIPPPLPSMGLRLSSLEARASLRSLDLGSLLLSALSEDPHDPVAGILEGIASDAAAVRLLAGVAGAERHVQRALLLLERRAMVALELHRRAIEEAQETTAAGEVRR